MRAACARSFLSRPHPRSFRGPARLARAARCAAAGTHVEDLKAFMISRKRLYVCGLWPKRVLICGEGKDGSSSEEAREG